MKGGKGGLPEGYGLCEVLCTVKSTQVSPCRLPVQCGIAEDAEPVSLLVADVLCDDAVEILVPDSVLVDELVGSCLVTAILNLQDFGEQTANYIVILAVIDLQPARSSIEAQQPVLEEEIPLHELHCVVRLVAARLVALQDPVDTARIN